MCDEPEKYGKKSFVTKKLGNSLEKTKIDIKNVKNAPLRYNRNLKVEYFGKNAIFVDLFDRKKANNPKISDFG